MVSPVVALLALHAALIAVKAGPEVDCPSADQVSAALEARLPGVVVPVAPLAGDEVWQLVLATDSGAGTRSMQLVGTGGRVLLRRSFPLLASGARDRDCSALAETVALIVERYLRELQYGAGGGGAGPPAAARVRAVGDLPERPGHRWDAFGGAGWRPGGDGGSAYELRVGVARTFGPARRLSLGLALAMEGAAAHRWQGGSGSLRRFPAEVRATWRWAVRARSSAEAGVAAGAELLSLDASSPRERRRERMLAPTAGLVGGWRYSFSRRGFVRVMATAGLAFLRYEFVLPDAAGNAVFGTPRAYGKLAAEAGLSFW